MPQIALLQLANINQEKAMGEIYLLGIVSLQ